MVQQKTKVLVLYEFFYPGYKAGGPVQSLMNMVTLLSSHFNFAVATTAFDLQEQIPYSSVQLDNWNSVQLSNNSHDKIPVFYSSKRSISFWQLYKNIKESNCNIIYINGFYTRHFLFPLIYKKFFLLKGKEIIVSPRGMLQMGALKSKSFQKEIFLSTMKIFGLMKNVKYHATTNDEAEDVKKIFGKSAKVVVAGNVPKTPFANSKKAVKQKGVLKLIYLSLITEKKNLLLLLNVLLKSNENIELDIYGPIKDQQYWQQCQQLIKQQSSSILISYKGDISPSLVQEIISKYDALVLLTKGENFGHALYESLSVGTPIITSKFTPWQDLENKFAGWMVDIDNEEAILKQINSLVHYNEQEWQKFSDGALAMAKKYFDGNNFVEDYSLLFN